jgi:hypothetical protein
MHVCYFVLCIHWYKIHSVEKDSDEGAVFNFDTEIHEDINCSCKYRGMYVQFLSNAIKLEVKVIQILCW